jgi:hypothetical protein
MVVGEMSITRKSGIEKAVDRMPAEQQIARPGDAWERFDAIPAQIDLIPEVASGFDPLERDEHGLPR